jgi:SOS-response transcriptional repressor LexA
MGLREKLKYSSFVSAIIGTALVVALVVSLLSDKGVWESTKSLKSDVESATAIKKPILTPFKSDVKSPIVVKKRIWTPYKKIQSNSIPPLETIWAIKLHFNLESDDTTIPLMIRTAAGANGKLASTVAGSSGVINQLITEKQTFYFSVSHPSIKARIKVLGYIKNPKTK